MNVLFLCTGNSARSIIAEALGNDPAITRGRFRAFSAGSHPKGAVDSLAVETLTQHGVATAGMRSKSWDEFSGPDAPQIDVVITVCDQAAAEACPIWSGQPVTGHWSIPDPAALTSPAERRRAFEDAFLMLKGRIKRFADLPLENLSSTALQQHLDAIGRIQGRVPGG